MAVNTSPENKRYHVLIVLAALVVLFASWDCAAVFLGSDTFLLPLPPGGAGGEPLDWSAAHCYGHDWRLTLLGWAGARFSDTALVLIVIYAAHALLWSGVYQFGRALWRDNPWAALLGVVLVRIAPDLFRVNLLSAVEPSRLIAVALAFWSSALVVRRRWEAACCAAALQAWLAPTVACWFAQFIVVALFCLNYEWGWKRSVAGALCYLAIAADPLVRFVVVDIVPEAPIPPDAMMGLHFFAEPALSPLAVSLWVYACLIVYLAMAFVWLKRHYDRRATPVVVIFFLMGTAVLALEVAFVGVIPVERAARFDLQNMRAFWFLWIAAFYAPELAGEFRAAWPRGLPWQPVFRGLAFSTPVVWSALTLGERLYRPPIWSRLIVVLMLALLAVTAFVLPHGGRPVAQPLCALVLAAVAGGAAALAAIRRVAGAARLACAVGVGTALFGGLLLLLDEGGLVRASREFHALMIRDRNWSEACRWAAGPAWRDGGWSVPWRPRQFRRATGHAVLVNREEVPNDPSERFEWFAMYAETHGWAGGPSVPIPQTSDALIEELRAFRRSLLMLGGRVPAPAADWLVVSPAVPSAYGIRYAICDRAQPLRLAPNPAYVVLDQLDFLPPGLQESFSVYRIQLAQGAERK